MREKYNNIIRKDLLLFVDKTCRECGKLRHGSKISAALEFIALENGGRVKVSKAANTIRSHGLSNASPKTFHLNVWHILDDDEGYLKSGRGEYRLISFIVEEKSRSP